MSLQSSTSFIATLNVTSASLRGTWQLSLGTDFYDVVIHGTTDLSFTTNLYALDPESGFGFSSVEGKPLNGKSSSDRSSIKHVVPLPISGGTQRFCFMLYNCTVVL